MFATAGEDVQLWCSSSLQSRLRFDVDESRVRTVTCVSWSADGQRLASVSQFCNFVNITDFTKTEHRHARTKVEGPCYCCAFSHNDSSSLCVGLIDGTVQLLRNGKVYYSYKPHKEKVTCVSYNENDSFVASGAYDGSVALLSVDTRTSRNLSAPTGKAVVGLQWSSHSKFKLVTTSMDGYLCIWDSSTRCLKSKHAVHPVRGSSCLSLSPINESLAVTAGHDSCLVLFDMLTTTKQASVATPETLESVAFLPDGQRVLAGGTSGRVYLYDLRNTRQTPPSVFNAHSKPVAAVATMRSQEVEAQMMAFVKACASEAATTTTRQPQHELCLPVRFSFGSDVEAAGDLAMASTPCTFKLPVITKDLVGTGQSESDEVFKEAHESNILDASWTSSGTSASVHGRRSFRLSDFMPVLNDSAMGPESRASLSNVSEEASVEDRSQRESLRESLHINGTECSVQNGLASIKDASALSNSVPSATIKLSEDQQIEGGAAMDVERHAEDSALAERLCRIEGMLSDQAHSLDAHKRCADDRLRRIDNHLLHVHMQMTVMQHSFMKDIQAMLQQVFDEVATLRAEIAELRGDS
ncbi:protein NEDD1 [Rhipicephalus sanguineus]|uniref:protein NEDD1 n=1 Tax=Rhipicephalus sanguineus TaxID=34632 RepID=UPI001893C6EC|nr:protein NEDD1 [Rhipicephalus sanguineus]